MPRSAARGARVLPAVVAALVAVGLLLAGCGAPSQRPSTPASREGRGGALEVLLDTSVAHWDPQRISSPADAALAVRMFVRTLTTFTAGGPGVGSGPVQADLATTTGSVSDGGRTWSFTLRPDVEWQDERTVTCEDVRYGVSRGFASDVLTGGPGTAVDLLDIPSTTDAQGRTVSAYAGPYRGTGQALFDRAVSCAGRTITFHLKRPTFDFDQVVAQPAFAPVRQDHDLRAGMSLMVFSDGPYMLEGEYVPGVGGRFVRTRTWKTLSDFVRRALPDSVTIREGLPTTTAIQRVIDDRGPDRLAVTLASAPPALARQLFGSSDLAGRTTNPPAPTVDYLRPDPASRVMADARVRRAFAVATDREAWVDAVGGPTAATAATSVLPSTVPGSSTTDPFGTPPTGDPAAARRLLQSAGLTLPVPVRVAYRSSTTTDAALAALRTGWGRAGFAVTLVPPGSEGADVDATSVTAPWPSAAAVLLPTFGSSTLPGVAALLARAESLESASERADAWQAADRALASAGAYVALAQRDRVLVHGSGVIGYADNPDLGGVPDLATVQLDVP